MSTARLLEELKDTELRLRLEASEAAQTMPDPSDLGLYRV